jgi:hypothetical protein
MTSAHLTRLVVPFQDKWDSALSSLEQPRKASSMTPLVYSHEKMDTKSPPAYDDAAIQHGALPARPAGAAKPVSRGLFPLDIPVLNQLRGKRCILASASPRRKQILSTVQPISFQSSCQLLRLITIIKDRTKFRDPALHKTRESE